MWKAPPGRAGCRTRGLRGCRRGPQGCLWPLQAPRGSHLLRAPGLRGLWRGAGGHVLRGLHCPVCVLVLITTSRQWAFWRGACVGEQETGQSQEAHDQGRLPLANTPEGRQGGSLARPHSLDPGWHDHPFRHACVTRLVLLFSSFPPARLPSVRAPG